MKKAVRLTRVSASQESGKERFFIRDRRRQELDARWREEAKLGGGIIYFKSVLPYSLQQTKTQGYDFSSHNPDPNPLFLAHCCPSVYTLLSLCAQHGKQLHGVGDQDSVLVLRPPTVLACLLGSNMASLLVEFLTGKGELFLGTSDWPDLVTWSFFIVRETGKCSSYC